MRGEALQACLYFRFENGADHRSQGRQRQGWKCHSDYQLGRLDRLEIRSADRGIPDALGYGS